jgi:hypothetical protein
MGYSLKLKTRGKKKNKLLKNADSCGTLGKEAARLAPSSISRIFGCI